jgi:hypothetical protein
MSPVEAKAYGIIDGIIGGDAATMVVEGDVTGTCTAPARVASLHPHVRRWNMKRSNRYVLFGTVCRM